MPLIFLLPISFPYPKIQGQDLILVGNDEVIDFRLVVVVMCLGSGIQFLSVHTLSQIPLSKKKVEKVRASLDQVKLARLRF